MLFISTPALCAYAVSCAPRFENLFPADIWSKVANLKTPIVTPRLTLQRFGKKDRDALLKISLHPQVAAQENRKPYSRHEAKDELSFVNTDKEGIPTEAGLRYSSLFSIRFKDNGRAIGLIALKLLLNNSGFMSYEVGFRVHPDNWRQGVVTEALAHFLVYLSSQGISSVLAKTLSTNEGSIRTLSKLGFEFINSISLEEAGYHFPVLNPATILNYKLFLDPLSLRALERF